MPGILAIKERLQTNLPGNKIAKILDYLLWKTIEPILLHTNLGRRLCTEILIQTYSDGRLSVSPLPRQQYIDTIFTAIVTVKNKDHAAKIKELKLERSALSTLANYCVSINLQIKQLLVNYVESLINKSFEKETQQVTIIKRICEDIGASPLQIDVVLNKSSAYFQQYRTFKEYIAEKFYRFSADESSKSIALTNIHVDSNDLFANYLLALDRALDRYSPAKGTLVAYIKWWFINAKTTPEFPHQYSESYSLPVVERKNMTSRYNSGSSQATNFAYSLEDANTQNMLEFDSAESLLIDSDYRLSLYRIFNYSRNTRLALLKLNIPFELTEDEKTLQLENVSC